MIDIVCAGDVVLRMAPEQPDGCAGSGNDEPSRKCEAGAMGFAISGSAAVTGIALNRLGVFTPIMGRISDDVVGRGVIPTVFREYGGTWQHLHMARGVKSSYIMELGGAEACRIQSLDAQKEFSSDDIDFNIVSKSRILHVAVSDLMESLIAGGAEELKYIIARAREGSVAVSLHVEGGLPPEAFKKDIAPLADIVVTSSGYIRAGEMRAAALYARDMIDAGVKAVAIKVADAGLYVQTSGRIGLKHVAGVGDINLENWAGRVLFSAPFKAHGRFAGTADCVVAGLLAGMATGRTIEESVDLACAADAFFEMEKKSVMGITSMEKITERIENGWDKKTSAIDTGLPYDEALKMYCAK
jgi:sugar/nucleoside kinase (ribokinase family)